MSSYTIEGILYRIPIDGDFRARFIADPEAALQDLPLTDDERHDLLAWDVKAMSARGVSDMLMMNTFAMLHGQEGMAEYLRRMNAPARTPQDA